MKQEFVVSIVKAEVEEDILRMEEEARMRMSEHLCHIAKIVLAAAFAYGALAADAGPASAVKVVSAVRKAAAIAKAGKKADTVIDGAKAVKGNKRVGPH